MGWVSVLITGALVIWSKVLSVTVVVAPADTPISMPVKDELLMSASAVVVEIPVTPPVKSVFVTDREVSGPAVIPVRQLVNLLFWTVAAAPEAVRPAQLHSLM